MQIHPQRDNIMIQAQQLAPIFSAKNEKNEIINLHDFIDKKNIVLYFYPKDDTPGCTIEANQFTELVEKFNQTDTLVFGVSKDNSDSHQSFINKFNLKISLIEDTSGEICNAYKVWREKEKNGVKKMGIVRSTFIIDKKGTIIYSEYAVTAQGHAKDMLLKVTQLLG